ncbi:hypothetical protein QCB45_02860 [Thiomicrorhabdus sp. ZW0627]|uniref:hypothetical protein n=1 Tax=Thiomicrorhabdus sp. ZW0627 TaxID=3039774 RepID=UPI0024365C5A|nr:hypothetical protein [Thiomicrorhabdus sp. ZW0627]MDG6773259.1 hypothetical protein [Thiomicrorhabdus sp. ZW0627]
MKRFMISAALAAATAAVTFYTPASSAEVGVTISVGQPGFYGVIQLGDYPRRPRLIYDHPIVVDRSPYRRPPLYLHVPPGHIKHWRMHCREYNACDRRVFFVDNDWYNREYVPHYQQRHRDRYEEQYRYENRKHFDKHQQRHDPRYEKDRRYRDDDYDDRKYRDDDRYKKDRDKERDKDRDRREDRRD